MNKLKVLANNIRALVNYHDRKVNLDNMPTYFWLEPTNHCNLRCVMCPNGAGKITIKKGYMDFELYTRIIDDIRPYASSVTLAVNGEALLHPRFFEMARYAAANGIKVLLNTSATLLDKDAARPLLESGIASVSFAFDGFTKSMYEKARVGANYEKTLENILYYLRLKKEKGKKLPYNVLSILMLGLEECAEDERTGFLRQFEGLIDEIRLRDVSTWGSTFKDSKEFFFRKNLRNYLPCARLWSTGVIGWNGDAVPCIYNANHEYVVGNLKEKSFKEIWNGEKMQRLRRAMVDGGYLDLSPLCEHCIVLGTPPVFGVPSGIRLSLADSVTNLLGYKFEKYTLRIANRIRKGRLSSITIRP